MLGQGNPCNIFSLLLDTVSMESDICKQQQHCSPSLVIAWLATAVNTFQRQFSSHYDVESINAIFITLLCGSRTFSPLRVWPTRGTRNIYREIITALYPRIKPSKVSIWNVNFPINYASIVRLSVRMGSESGDMAIVIAYKRMLHSLGLAIKVTYE